jgi:hypothetical protein
LDLVLTSRPVGKNQRVPGRRVVRRVR